MESGSRKDTHWSRLKRTWISSLGVQCWLVEAGRCWIATTARRVADEYEPAPARAPEEADTGPGGADTVAPTSLLSSYPHTAEALRTLISHMRETLIRLDDVKDYTTIEEVDNDMYQLWKELERKMVKHRQSEARYQLADMFRI